MESRRHAIISWLQQNGHKGLACLVRHEIPAQRPRNFGLGDAGAPFTWDEDRRFLIRAELDAFFFRLYGIERDDVDYIMETFQTESGGLKNHDIAKYGSYRTKETILQFYDRLTATDGAGVSYETPITPPPGQSPRHPDDS